MALKLSGLKNEAKSTNATQSAPGVGVLLRATRERLGVDMPSVSADLRIRQVYLLAIEEGEYDKLPGGAYASGFVRTYSEYLGLDGDEILRRFRADYRSNGQQNSFYMPTPLDEQSFPTLGVLIAAIFIAALAYGGWFALTRGAPEFVDQVSNLPNRVADMVSDQLPADLTTTTPSAEAEAEAEAEGTKTAEGTERPAEATTESAPAEVPPMETLPEASPPPVAEMPDPLPLDEGAPSSPQVAEVPPTASMPRPEVPQVTTETAETTAEAVDMPGDQAAAAGQAVDQAVAADPAPQQPAVPQQPEKTPQIAATPQTPTPSTAAANAPHIQLHAEKESWIQVHDTVSDEVVLTRLMQPGEVLDVPNRPGLLLTTGNAGALIIVVDGREIPRLGKLGAVARNIELTRESLLARKARN